MPEYYTSNLEESGWRLFVNYFKEFYHLEFEELSNQYKDEVIEEVLVNNSKYFNREDVLKENLCSKCGMCCRELLCPHLDQETNLCTIHDNPESPICSIYPWDDDTGFILTLNCGYQKKYCHQFFDKFFETAIKMGKKDDKK